MEPNRKKTKITGHFRVALKPQDVNIQPGLKKLKSHHDTGKENVEVITISDDDDDDFKRNKKDSNRLENNKRSSIIVSNSSSSSIKNLDVAEQQELLAGNLGVTSANVAAATTASFNLVDIKPSQSYLSMLIEEPKSCTSSSASSSPDKGSQASQQTATTIASIIRNAAESQQPQHLEHPAKQFFQYFTGRSSKFRNLYLAPPELPLNVVDHDKSLLDDILCEPHYAYDSFKYDREQELKYINRKYLQDGHHNNLITPIIRARLVDWLVQLQSTFSLYHEPLYMAVKIADHYLMKKTVPRQQLQLLYMTSLFISAKFDERLPPVEIDELIHAAAGVYSREQVISCEVDILTTLNFNIRFPLSYVFLRRFARCTKSDQRTLLLARFILESSLLDYEMIEVLESKIAAASLLLAFYMLHLDDAWNETAEFYTGYKLEELDILSQKLNHMIARPTDKRISTVRKKYSHEVFLEVATIPPLAKT